MNQTLLEFITANTASQWSTPSIVPPNLWDSDWPWAPLLPNAQFDSAAIMEEMRSVDHLFVEHRAADKISSYGHDGWYSLVLHGIDETKTENYDRYGFKSEVEAGYKWTDVCNIIPQTANFIKALPFTNHGRVRIMRLSPGGYIMPHTDGPGRIFGPFNFAINNPQGCQFVFEERGTVPFEPGLGMFLDIGRRHAIVNNSAEPRYHVIVHGRPTINISQAVQSTINQLKDRLV